jgi:hypothetical protein
VTVEVAQESLDLEGGFPKVAVDTAVIKQTSSLTATLREYSRRNLQLMLGEGVSGSEPADFATTLASDAAAAAVSITLDTGAGASVDEGQLLVLYTVGSPEKISVVRVSAITGDVLTLDDGTPLMHAYTVAGTVVYAAHPVAIGAITQTNYFAVQVLQTERATGRPIGYNFWKAAISSGMNDGSNADDFASTELGLKLLVPAAAEYDTGGDLEHLANIIPTHPTGLYFGGGD